LKNVVFFAAVFFVVVFFVLVLFVAVFFVVALVRAVVRAVFLEADRRVVFLEAAGRADFVLRRLVALPAVLVGPSFLRQGRRTDWRRVAVAVRGRPEVVRRFLRFDMRAPLLRAME
jgi:hypothetical protein